MNDYEELNEQFNLILEKIESGQELDNEESRIFINYIYMYVANERSEFIERLYAYKKPSLKEKKNNDSVVRFERDLQRSTSLFVKSIGNALEKQDNESMRAVILQKNNLEVYFNCLKEYVEFFFDKNTLEEELINSEKKLNDSKEKMLSFSRENFKL